VTSCAAWRCRPELSRGRRSWVLIGRHRATRRDTDAVVEMFAAAIYTVEDGRVSHMAYYFNRAEALEAAGLSDG
jgi:ketosteroid isomerase-like protein